MKDLNLRLVEVIVAILALYVAYRTYTKDSTNNPVASATPSTTVNISIPEPKTIVTEAQVESNVTTKVGGCNFDEVTTREVKASGQFNEVVFLCESRLAVTVGQSFRIESLSEDERFQYINYGEFNKLNRISMNDSQSKIAAYDRIAQNIDLCFTTTFHKGASPPERIDLEIQCLKDSGMSAQDKVFYLIVENAKLDGRNVLS